MRKCFGGLAKLRGQQEGALGNGLKHRRLRVKCDAFDFTHWPVKSALCVIIYQDWLDSCVRRSFIPCSLLEVLMYSYVNSLQIRKPFAQRVGRLTQNAFNSHSKWKIQRSLNVCCQYFKIHQGCLIKVFHKDRYWLRSIHSTHKHFELLYFLLVALFCVPLFQQNARPSQDYSLLITDICYWLKTPKRHTYAIHRDLLQTPVEKYLSSPAL